MTFFATTILSVSHWMLAQTRLITGLPISMLPRLSGLHISKLTTY